MDLEKSLLAILDKVKSIDSLVTIDVTDLLATHGGIAIISSIATSIAVITFSISLLKRWSEGELAEGGEKTALSTINFIFIALFFFMSAGYLYVVHFFQGLQTVLFDSVFSQYLLSLRADLDYLLSTIHEQGVKGLLLIAINPLNATLDVAFLSGLLLSFMILLYVMLSFFKLLFAISLMLGPIAVAFSFLFPDIMKQWKNFVLCGLCYPVFTGVGLIAISQTGIVRLVAGNIALGWYLPAIITLALNIALLLYIPKIIAEIFGVSFADFTELIFSIFTFLSPLKWLRATKSVKG
jgi:hypothetical protein